MLQAAFFASTLQWNEAKEWKDAEIKLVRQMVKALPLAQQSISKLLQDYSRCARSLLAMRVCVQLV